MNDYIPNFVLNFQFNSILGILLYWLPVLFCLVYRSVKTYKDIRYDIEKRNKGGTNHYQEPVTVGSLLFGVFLIFTPAINLLYTIFTTAPAVLNRFFRIIGDILNQPLIPRKK